MNARTPFVYVIVAGLCVMLHNGVMISTDYLGVPLWLSVLLSFGVVASSGYVLHGLFTFRRSLSVGAFGRYALAMSANVPLAFVTTWFWHDRIHLDMTEASPLASACLLVLNFALSRWAIGNRRRQSIADR